MNEDAYARPSLRQLQYFVAVADHGAFGKAAKALAVSQPSLSKQLSTMEYELGVTLFERTSRRVALSVQGAQLLPKARQILHDLRDFRAAAQGTGGPFGNKLTIGVLPSIGAYFMPIANRRLHAVYPQLRVAVREGATGQLLSMLKDGRLDLVVGTPSNDPAIASAPLFTETLWACAAPDDPISAHSTPLPLTALADKPLLSLSADYRLARIVEGLAAKAGTYVSREYEGASLDAVRQMAVMGAGVAVLPSLYALAEAVRDPDFALRRIDDPDAVHEIALHWRRSAPMQDDFHALAQELIAVKREIRAARTDQFR